MDILLGFLIILLFIMGASCFSNPDELGFVGCILLLFAIASTIWLVVAIRTPSIGQEITYLPITNVESDGASRSIVVEKSRIYELNCLYDSKIFEVKKIYIPYQWKKGIYCTACQSTEYIPVKKESHETKK